MSLQRTSLFAALLLCIGLTGCDEINPPTEVFARITSIDFETDGDLIEINDVAGRQYIQVTELPATVNVPITSLDRDYLVVVLNEVEGGGYTVLETSDQFTAREFSGSEFVTSGDVNAVLTIQ